MTSAWQKPGRIVTVGSIVAGGLFMLAAVSIAALVVIATEPNMLSAEGDAETNARGYILHVAWFTTMQAALSAFLAFVVALPVARACWRRSVAWKAHLLVLFSFLPVVLPTTVAASGLIGMWGHSGVLSNVLNLLGLASLPPIYGLGGVLLAHVFFNAPLMLRVLSGAIASISAAHWRISAQHGLTSWQRFYLIEWPAIRRVVPGMLALVFLLCFTSFSLIMMLGGGPSVTTLEVSIYTALRFDFNLPMAGKLAVLQLCICAIVVMFLAFFTGPSWAAASARRLNFAQKGESSLTARLLDTAILLLFIMLAVLPVLVVMWRGISSHLITVLTWPAFYQAAASSMIIAIASGTLATILALTLATARTVRANAGMSVWGIDVSISLYLAVSAIVLGTGLFILLRSVTDIFLISPILVLLANMLVALPFAYRVIEGRLSTLAKSHDRLCAGLDVRGWRRFRLITLPALAPELGYAAGLSAALSLGDMTVIALFGSQQFQTLPWLLYQTMSRYRSGEAAALALLLLCLTFVIFMIHVGLARRLSRPKTN